MKLLCKTLTKDVPTTEKRRRIPPSAMRWLKVDPCLVPIESWLPIRGRMAKAMLWKKV